MFYEPMSQNKLQKKEELSAYLQASDVEFLYETYPVF